MNLLHSALAICLVLPPGLMLLAALLPHVARLGMARLWQGFIGLSIAGACVAAVGVALRGLPDAASSTPFSPWLGASVLGGLLATLVQLLGTCIGAFSARYLQGESGQRRYLSALAGVLAAVHVLLLADHWTVLLAAWAAIGIALQHLLCFYPDRPFALLAAFKKRLADRLADALLIAAAVLAWREVGSGSLADLWAHVGQVGASPALQVSAVCVVLAVVLRTALLPAHGWLIQVMEAPTPVSAMLHAGVVNLGGYVLIRFAPLLESAAPARWLLVAFGLATAVVAGLVMLTRISIKVRLAWSTVAQMGFMVLECGLGLYSLAALHLVGHSLYKAHAFLSASSVVQDTRLRELQGEQPPAKSSLLAAPLLSVAMVLLVQAGLGGAAWPWWWSVILALAWAPLLWLPGAGRHSAPMVFSRAAVGLLMVAGLTALAMGAHLLPLGTQDRPDTRSGIVALLGMACLHGLLVAVQMRPRALAAWRRACYAGLYIDEFYTRLALRLWPTHWTPAARNGAHRTAARTVAMDAQP
ncbi:NADH-quinone oxidoreductase subunit L [Ralstonia pickettii]|jgi:NAD(P)H-quinone oxidoreductase subunit 5|uniref:Probable inorganic carbon transporter subunit DabB n=3 Tax=Ralstonia TaxID=48736 RepID=C6BKZ0_RALP1|nr:MULTISPECIES: NADH-quinone oxidoreductase subunit L [Ralstonia]MDE2202235.1 NADH-quinone oxidoreductase subunit L [Burkholderiaceae bacterium]MBA9883085.1 NADH-quinone oxidoreductase subunit L [Ralstonia pickettii]MBA9892861.1 NADH-quinone oxidoreductase subunit L [Ralstonia pickettii]MBA9925124.1 NADH-quinone oxidoreductase subunit L [Ralstonia pickettii]MBB0093627.1 NADH-quinone oxidoreductase subunit L [Ralstonia pickettii]